MGTSAQESHVAGGSCNGQRRTKQPIRVECLWLCHFQSDDEAQDTDWY